MESTSEFVANMNGLGDNTEKWDLLMIYVIIKKLGEQSRLIWETSLGAVGDLPTLEKFNELLSGRFRTLEAMGSSSLKSPNKVNVPTINEQIMKCICCKDDHMVHKCETFTKLSILHRRETVKQFKLCHNCFNKSHSIYQCKV